MGFISKYKQRTYPQPAMVGEKVQTATVSQLQKLQRRVLELSWRNIGRLSPSTDLSNSLMSMYTNTVYELEREVGKTAHVSQTDAELWDLYGEWHLDKFGKLPGKDLITREFVVQALRS
jgi:hypothetical protein